MLKDSEASLRIAKTIFRIGAIGPLRKITRPIESEWMFKYYEGELEKTVAALKDQESFNNFSESFMAHQEVPDFSTHHKRKLSIQTTEEGRVVELHSITDAPITGKLSSSCVKITLKDRKVKTIEFWGQRNIDRSIGLTLQNPQYNEVPNLNKWYFLEYVNRKIAEFGLERM